jgi:GNAT superfamily N-acetyltransferase
MKTLIEKGNSYVDFDIYEDPCFDEETGEELSYEYAKIDNLFVDAAERGKGIARQLLGEAVAEIKKYHPGLEIKIVAEPQEACVDQDRLMRFYDSIDGIDEVVAV